jgi:predicted transglutaminase-like cysteine proteinase
MFVATFTLHRTLKIVTIAVTLVVSWLDYAAAADLSYPRELQAVAEPVSLELPPAASARFFAISASLNAVTKPAKSETLAATTGPIAAALPVPRQGNASQITSDSPFASAAVFARQPGRLEAKVNRITFDYPSLPPLAFVRFCMRYPQDCKVREMATRSELEPLTKMRRAELAKVNREVNRAIMPHENGQDVSADEWLVSPREGDCKDYAVTKRHKLLERGWPTRSLLLAEVVIASGEHHLVLIVRTREDDLVLDNLSEYVHPVSHASYRWVRAQQPINPKFWSAINVASSARLAMDAR